MKTFSRGISKENILNIFLRWVGEVGRSGDVSLHDVFSSKVRHLSNAAYKRFGPRRGP